VFGDMCVAENLELAVSSPDAADAFINRHQYFNIVGNLNRSEVGDDNVEVQSDLCF
jgi:hypothetical protein